MSMHERLVGIRHNFNGKFGRKTIVREREKESINYLVKGKQRIDKFFQSPNFRSTLYMLRSGRIQERTK